MVYDFICKNCGKQHQISMPMADYTAKGHYCECGYELIRDPKSLNCNFIVKCDGFFGKSNSN